MRAACALRAVGMTRTTMSAAGATRTARCKTFRLQLLVQLVQRRTVSFQLRGRSSNRSGLIGLLGAFKRSLILLYELMRFAQLFEQRTDRNARSRRGTWRALSKCCCRQESGGDSNKGFLHGILQIGIDLAKSLSLNIGISVRIVRVERETSYWRLNM